MNKSILLVVLPCIIALVTAVYYPGYSTFGAGYPAYYGSQLNAYQQQNALYNAGNLATAELRNARVLNYLFGFLLLLDLFNATGNSITKLG